MVGIWDSGFGNPELLPAGIWDSGNAELLMVGIWDSRFGNPELLTHSPDLTHGQETSTEKKQEFGSAPGKGWEEQLRAEERVNPALKLGAQRSRNHQAGFAGLRAGEQRLSPQTTRDPHCFCPNPLIFFFGFEWFFFLSVFFVLGCFFSPETRSPGPVKIPAHAPRVSSSGLMQRSRSARLKLSPHSPETLPKLSPKLRSWPQFRLANPNLAGFRISAQALPLLAQEQPRAGRWQRQPPPGTATTGQEMAQRHRDGLRTLGTALSPVPELFPGTDRGRRSQRDEGNR